MKVILGLGNPGREFEQTRHNVGWWAVDHLADVWRLGGWHRDGDAWAVDGAVGVRRVRLIKPLTYMNLSGAALLPYVSRPFWSAAADLLVVVDDVALPVGSYRLRARGTAGGHNGLKNIEYILGSREYGRLRVGVGPPDGSPIGDLVDYVLSPFPADERAAIDALLASRIEAPVETWLADGIERAMSVHNAAGRVPPPRSEPPSESAPA